MVLVCHLVHPAEPPGLAARFLLGFFHLMGKGVNLFFTLSGFLIAWPFWKRKSEGAGSLVPRGYAWRRFWKIYPPLALSVVLLTPAFILWKGEPSVMLAAAAKWLSGLAFLMPVSGKLNPVMWSLVVEVHFYLALPILFLLTKPLPARACLWIISLFLLAVPILIQTVTGSAPAFTPDVKDPFCTGLGWFALGVAVAGIDVCCVMRRRRSIPAPAGSALHGCAGAASSATNGTCSTSP
jgi:peptidoglycan/LPS O-acetylase OafA/YrhL